MEGELRGGGEEDTVGEVGLFPELAKTITNKIPIAHSQSFPVPPEALFRVTMTGACERAGPGGADGLGGGCGLGVVLAPGDV